MFVGWRTARGMGTRGVGMPSRAARVAVLVLGAICLSGAAFAQSRSVVERPADRVPPLELPEPEPEREVPVLPPVPAPTLGEIQGDEPDAAIVVERVRFEGNTAIDASTLENAVRPFLGRRLAAEGLEALRRRVTEIYVAAGYVNSGAILPPQDLTSGRLLVRVVEGELEGIHIVGTRHYRPAVLRDRVSRRIEAPLNVDDLERAIRILDQDARIDRIDARLRPGSARGRAILELAIVESERRVLELAFDNDESPSVGAYAGRARVGNENVFGFGDRFLASVVRTEGLTRVAGVYEFPVHPSGTRLFVDVSYGDAELVSLRELGVESTDLSIGVGLRQTVWHTPWDRVDLALLLENRRSETVIFQDRPISFVLGPDNGRSEVSVVRAIAEWTHRGRASVFALRSMSSFGLDVLGPTIQSGEIPDGEFVSWYGQARAVHRFSDAGLELGFRADVQLANRPLLAIEQFAIGGPDSVRGYRRNQVVRDQGLSAALDLRIPVWRTEDARTLLAVTPFADFGYVWNRDRPTGGITSLSSLGVGLDFRPHPKLDVGLEYAYPFRDTGNSGDLQDESVYLRATWRAF